MSEFDIGGNEFRSNLYFRVREGLYFAPDGKVLRSLEEFTDLVGLPEIREQERRYAAGDQAG